MLHWQGESETGTQATVAENLDIAAHQAKQAFADCQTESGTAAVPELRIVALEKRLEQRRLILLAHAHSGIDHLTAQQQLFTVPADQFKPDLNPPLVGKLDGVIAEIGQYLLDPHGIEYQVFGNRRINVQE
jgi:hypothetical protein